MNLSFEYNYDSGSGDFSQAWNISTTTTIPPPTIPSDQISTTSIFIVCLGFVCFGCMMLPFCIESIMDPPRRSNSRAKYCWCCCFKRNTLSDFERNTRFNEQILNSEFDKNKLVVIELAEIVVADPFDATENCSICLEEIKEGNELGGLPCGHKHFHKDCINNWITISANKSCPICRTITL